MHKGVLDGGTIYEPDLGRIRLWHIVAGVISVVFAGIMLCVAIFGPGTQPDGAILFRVVGYSLAVVILGLWAFVAWRLVKAAEVTVCVDHEGLVIETPQGFDKYMWKDVRSIHHTDNRAPFAKMGLAGWAIVQILYGGQDTTVVLELVDGNRISVPYTVLFYESMLMFIDEEYAKARGLPPP